LGFVEGLNNKIRVIQRRSYGLRDLSAYDANYLALALELRLPIACNDGPLRSVLARAGVKLA